MLETVQKLIADLGGLGTKRIALMGGVALALMAALAMVAMRGSSSDMGFLYTDLDPAATQTMAEKLQAQGIPFTISPDGTSIMAPQEKVAELRMAMAGDKLGGKIGYDVLDQEEPFGISASRAKLNETRAIEGELSRSIQSLQGVSAARVHIVMPERAMFATESRKATAAVTVKTRGRLPSEAVDAIRYLVASSVPELAPEAISIVDQSGALLARSGEAGQVGASDADERQISVEARLRDQIEALLEPIVGPGKVRAEVSAKINRDVSREEAQVFDPDTQVIARQVSVESGNQDEENSATEENASVGAQLPEATAAPGTPGDTRKSASNQSSEDTTYQTSSKHTVTMRAPGEVERLTVAVMVDGGEKGLPAAQVQRLTRLVENAVGIDTERGDSVVVESMAFSADDSLQDTEESFFSSLPTDQLFALGQLLIIGVVGLVAIRMIRPKLEIANDTIHGGDLSAEQAMAALPQTDPQEAALRELEDLATNGSGLDQEIALAQIDGRVKVSALKRIGVAINESPPEAASVIRQWMNA